MKNIIRKLGITLVVMVILAFICSAFVPIIRGSVEPQIIGYGHIKYDDLTGKYFVKVELDTQFNKVNSPRYYVDEYLSAIFPSFPIKSYINEENVGMLVTVFTADNLDGYHIAITIEDACSIKKAYNNVFLEVVSYYRGYCLFFMFFGGFLIWIIIPKEKPRKKKK